MTAILTPPMRIELDLAESVWYERLRVRGMSEREALMAVRHVVVCMRDAFYYGKFLCGFKDLSELDHHREWLYDMGAVPGRDGRYAPKINLCRLDSRGSFKTTIRSVVYPCFTILNAPNDRLYYFGSNDDKHNH